LATPGIIKKPPSGDAEIALAHGVDPKHAWPFESSEKNRPAPGRRDIGRPLTVAGDPVEFAKVRANLSGAEQLGNLRVVILSERIGQVELSCAGYVPSHNGGSPMSEVPFESIESAQEYVRLLALQVDAVRVDVDNDLADAIHAESRRRADALRIVDYKLKQLAQHLGGCTRILNDLRMLRRLLVMERESVSAPASAATEVGEHRA
jgi:hypothetical protein